MANEETNNLETATRRFAAPVDRAVESDGRILARLAGLFRFSADYLKVRLTDEGNFENPSDDAITGFGHDHGFGDPFRRREMPEGLITDRPNSKRIFKQLALYVHGSGISTQIIPSDPSVSVVKANIAAENALCYQVLPGRGTLGVRCYARLHPEVEDLSVQIRAVNLTATMLDLDWHSTGAAVALSTTAWTMVGAQDAADENNTYLQVFPGMPQDIALFVLYVDKAARVGCYQVSIFEWC